MVTFNTGNVNKFDEVLGSRKDDMRRRNIKGCAVLREQALVGIERTCPGHGNENLLLMVNAIRRHSRDWPYLIVRDVYCFRPKSIRPRAAIPRTHVNIVIR